MLTPIIIFYQAEKLGSITNFKIYFFCVTVIFEWRCRMENDEDEIYAPGRLCGDLHSWIPLDSTINVEHTERKQRF